MEEKNLKQVDRELKSTTAEDGSSFKVIFEVQYMPMFKKSVFNQATPKNIRVNKGKVDTPKSQEGIGGSYYFEKPICVKCGRKHEGKCLVGMGNFYCCGMSFHMKRDFPIRKYQGKENSQEQATVANPNTPKKNRFYDLKSRGDQDDSPDVFTNTFHGFSIHVNSSLDPGATLYFVTSFVE